MTDVDDFLAHHGVKGMRWGVRKQNRESDRLARRKILKDKNLDELIRRSDQEKKLKKLIDEDLNPYRTKAKDYAKKIISENKGVLISGVITGASTAVGLAFLNYRLSNSFNGISTSAISLR